MSRARTLPVALLLLLWLADCGGPHVPPAPDLAGAVDLGAAADLARAADLASAPDLTAPTDAALPEWPCIARKLGDCGWTLGTTKNNGVVAFVAGPAPAPLGSGSLRLGTPEAADKATLQRLTDHGRIANFTASYRWYRIGGGVAAPSLRIVIDTPEANPMGLGFDKTLIYEPYQDGHVKPLDGVWTKETITQGKGGFWLIDYATTPETKAFSPIRTLAEWGVLRPGLDLGKIVSVELGAGSANAGLDGNVDDVQLGYTKQGGAPTNAVFDFESP